MPRVFFFVCLLLFSFSKIYAQKNDMMEKPTAILIMLHISTSKIEALQKTGTKEDVNDVIATDREINNTIMEDFNSYFRFCPVYFFYDTVAEFVKQKDWEKVEFYDKEYLKTGKKIEISNIDNYIIAEVNYPPTTEYPTIDAAGNEHAPEYTVEYANTRDYGVICYDKNFRLLRSKMQYTNIALRRTGNIFKPSTLHYKFTGAIKFQEKLKKYCIARP